MLTQMPLHAYAHTCRLLFYVHALELIIHDINPRDSVLHLEEIQPMPAKARYVPPPALHSALACYTASKVFISVVPEFLGLCFSRAELKEQMHFWHRPPAITFAMELPEGSILESEDL